MLLLAALPLVLAVGCGGNEVRTTDNIARECALIPFPRVFELQEGGLYLDASTFAVDSRFDNASKEKIREFASLLSDCSGTRVRIKELAPAAGNGSVEGASLSFVLDDSLSPEEYSLDAGPQGAVVRASDYNSVLYSLATLRQLLPVEIYCCSDGSRCTAGVAKSSCKGVKWTIPFCHIEDYPQYSYRGVMLDCSRHFFTVDEVKRFLDIMAEFKLNRFHWHLTDDQGWRVEIKKYPQLTEVGSVRGGTMVGRDFDSDDGVPHGGFYTQDELRDVVAYAQELGITIVPEVDLPGHMVAALASYPELGCTGGPYDVRRIWGIADDVLCAGKDATYRFLDDVINEIADIFPGELFHIGGDECPKVRWENCPDCQAKIAELGLSDKDGVSAEQYLQNYVTDHVRQTLAAKGKRIIGWEEIAEGNLDKNAMVHYWRGWKSVEETLCKFIAEGYDVLMSPTNFFYIDYAQSEDRSSEPLSYNSTLTIEKMYSYDSTKLLSPEQLAHVKGVQANLWTEYISDWQQIEYMLLPRMFALSCIAWDGDERPDFETFMDEVRKHQFQVLDILGYNYRKGN